MIPIESEGPQGFSLSLFLCRADFAEVGSAKQTYEGMCPLEDGVTQLSVSETERIQHKREACHRRLPEFVPFLKELQALGLVEGWHSVKAVRELTAAEKQAWAQRPQTTVETPAGYRGAQHEFKKRRG